MLSLQIIDPLMITMLKSFIHIREFPDVLWLVDENYFIQFIFNIFIFFSDFESRSVK